MKQSAGCFHVGKAVDVIKFEAWAEKLPKKIDSELKVFADDSDKPLFVSEECKSSNTPVWTAKKGEESEIWVPINCKKLWFRVFKDKMIGSDELVAEVGVDYLGTEEVKLKHGRYEMTLVADESAESADSPAIYIGDESVQVAAVCGVCGLNDKEDRFFRVMYGDRELFKSDDENAVGKEKEDEDADLHSGPSVNWKMCEFTIPSAIPNVHDVDKRIGQKNVIFLI